MAADGQVPSNYYQSALYRIQERDGTPRVVPRGQPSAKTTERQVKSVPEPIASRPSDEQLWTTDEAGERKPNADFLRHHFYREGRLTELQALSILQQATEVLSREANLLSVDGPVTICGDIHGQYYDLLKLFEIGGPVTNGNYLFLGDYVDRGCFGIECLLYLYSLKIWYPNQVFMLRGNHECRHLTEYFTFKQECLHKYSARVYEACIQSFCALPVAAVVDGRFFCVHGGISPELNTLDDLYKMDRFQEPGSRGLLCDLLWADPIADFDRPSDSTTFGFAHNQTRGCSYFFTYAAVCSFLERNQLLGVIRGHEAQDEGRVHSFCRGNTLTYRMYRKTPAKKFTSVITIFSAPNYLDVYHNRGAVLKYANKNITIRQFNWTSHPYWLPNFMDAFTWSLPFVGAKITEMLLAILSICSEEELDSVDSDEDETRPVADLAMTANELAQRRQEIKNKILAVGKMQRIFQLLREEAESASELSPDNENPSSTLAPRLGPDALSVQGNNMRRYIRNFEDARRSDIVNERLPEFTPEPTSFPSVPAPSMRMQKAGTSGNMEVLIRRVLEETEDGDIVETIADRISQGRRVTGRPRALKRFETT
ncbi:Metallo-dependent phosphatase [Heliocybe sulcata]|uniref:Serine/threonine-protein phosphatase n=1 Tax=Heliocybe sulcata TaxID=5364 RepID=A0A5C3N0G8_9AGAM|nr:Metallo-dependent phosphatase [Heliocybe sulcata]